jgi:hypothetical protein
MTNPEYEPPTRREIIDEYIACEREFYPRKTVEQCAAIAASRLGVEYEAVFSVIYPRGRQPR